VLAFCFFAPFAVCGETFEVTSETGGGIVYEGWEGEEPRSGAGGRSHLGVFDVAFSFFFGEDMSSIYRTACEANFTKTFMGD
jgi:hypothetical protein